MATPQWVRFSPVPRSIEQICLQDLAEVFTAFDFKLAVITELGVIPDKAAFGDIDRPFIKSDTVEDALSISRAWRGVAMTFTVGAIWRNISLHLWRDDEHTNVCLFIDTGIV